MRTGVHVGDAMTSTPVLVSPELTVTQCARLMKKKGVGSVLVRDGGKLHGIVTEKDFLEKVLAKGVHGDELRVKEVMTKKLVTIEPQEDIYDALMKMNDEEVRRLPVVKGGKLVGILTQKDILKIEPQLFDYMVEKFQVSYKPIFRGLKRGACEQCGHMGRLFRVEEMMLCRLCKES